MDSKWREQEVYIASSNFASILKYGNSDGLILKPIMESMNISATSRFQAAQKYWSSLSFKPETHSFQLQASAENAMFTFFTNIVSYISYFTFLTLSLVLNCIGDKNVLSQVHVLLVFL